VDAPATVGGSQAVETEWVKITHRVGKIHRHDDTPSSRAHGTEASRSERTHPAECIRRPAHNDGTIGRNRRGVAPRIPQRAKGSHPLLGRPQKGLELSEAVAGSAHNEPTIGGHGASEALLTAQRAELLDDPVCPAKRAVMTLVVVKLPHNDRAIGGNIVCFAATAFQTAKLLHPLILCPAKRPFAPHNS
jgi:hypothetical protein